jgi:hypothetical protein
MVSTLCFFFVRNSGGNLPNCPANQPPSRRVRPFYAILPFENGRKMGNCGVFHGEMKF